MSTPLTIAAHSNIWSGDETDEDNSIEDHGKLGEDSDSSSVGVPFKTPRSKSHCHNARTGTPAFISHKIVQ